MLIHGHTSTQPQVWGDNIRHPDGVYRVLKAVQRTMGPLVKQGVVLGGQGRFTRYAKGVDSVTRCQLDRSALVHMTCSSANPTAYLMLPLMMRDSVFVST